jgi:hypothetical protein
VTKDVGVPTGQAHQRLEHGHLACNLDGTNTHSFESFAAAETWE